tara:strand:+ start:72382 stop:72636 length:255 start_codon:yes stop_codon:yes gene_type:complete
VRLRAGMIHVHVNYDFHPERQEVPSRLNIGIAADEMIESSNCIPLQSRVSSSTLQYHNDYQHALTEQFPRGELLPPAHRKSKSE